MKILSVNVSLPRTIVANGKSFPTGIYKEPVLGRVRLGRLDLEGDEQADLTVHGGPEQALYAYPAAHYLFWRRELPEMELPFGMFGENLTVEGPLESEAHVGDRFRLGTAIVQVTKPRLPCWKLALKFGRQDIIPRFLASGRTGYYFSVVEEGTLGAGDEIVRIARDPAAFSIAEFVRLYSADKQDPALLRRAVDVLNLSERWRQHFAERLRKLEGTQLHR